MESEENPLIVPGYDEWVDAANFATARLFDAHRELPLDPDKIRLYEVLSIASSLCAIASAIHERR